jgi:hypothetical protein
MKMKKVQLALGAVILALFAMRLGTAQDQKPAMSFFVTSQGPGSGASLGGVAGADAYCQKLATAAGAGTGNWRAYLSVSAADGKAAVNARDRIGKGPWYNAKGVKIADDVANLHSDSNNLNKETALDEKGNRVNARGDKPNKHDILTGSQPDGTAYPASPNLTCENWTVGNADKLAGAAQVGHHDREGNSPGVSSWNSAHASRGCGQEDLKASGGDGLFYCFLAQ